jgi:glycerol-3-phosphate acyltransferase PlsY
MLQIIGLALLAYLIGSIPFGFAIGRSMGVDLRTVGSGNVGTTNVYRALGMRIAILVFILDVTKGFVGTRVVPQLLETGIPVMHIRFICGIAVIVGSIASVFMRFRGGKGVATGVGVFLGLQPAATVICLALWTILVAIWRYVSLGSVCAALALPPLVAVMNPKEFHHDPVFYLALVVTAIVILRHKSNIERLVAGTENRIGRAGGEKHAG